MLQKKGGVAGGEDEARRSRPIDQTSGLAFSFLRIAADALKCVSTSFKVGGGIFCKVSMRFASQPGAGIAFSVRGFGLGGIVVAMTVDIIRFRGVVVNVGHGVLR